MKSGGFQVKSTQNLIKSDVSTKTLQFGGCMEGAMTPDFMKSGVIAPLLHSSNWIVLVETPAFTRFWVDFMRISKDQLPGMVTPMFVLIIGQQYLVFEARCNIYISVSYTKHMDAVFIKNPYFTYCKLA